MTIAGKTYSSRLLDNATPLVVASGAGMVAAISSVYLARDPQAAAQGFAALYADQFP